ncbi:MAG: hypothetical protein FD127_2080 [Acidimicrobiaceae bacterium]|nr:MAG: hypothetical protein FD127_2080 [Acidimicrobiaceae bacterium]
MAVHTYELDCRGTAGALDCPRRIAVAEVEAELRVVLPGGDVLVGVRVHPRRDAQHHLRRRQPLPAQRLDAIELFVAVDDDVAHARFDRGTQLVDALVVAVEGERIGRDAGLLGDEHLAATGHVEEHALLVRQAGHRLAEERLGRVHRPLVAERVDRLAAPMAKVRLVVDEQRRAVLGGELGDRGSSDAQGPVGRDRGGIG